MNTVPLHRFALTLLLFVVMLLANKAQAFHLEATYSDESYTIDGLDIESKISQFTLRQRMQYDLTFENSLGTGLDTISVDVPGLPFPLKADIDWRYNTSLMWTPEIKSGFRAIARIDGTVTKVDVEPSEMNMTGLYKTSSYTLGGYYGTDVWSLTLAHVDSKDSGDSILGMLIYHITKNLYLNTGLSQYYNSDNSGSAITWFGLGWDFDR